MSAGETPKDVIIVSPRRKLYIDHLIVHTMNNSASMTPQVTILPDLCTNQGSSLQNFVDKYGKPQ